MNYLGYWERFEKTGKINDYLNYLACTSEEAMSGEENKNEEGGCISDSIVSNWDGFISHAHWGL
jgi:hypothetical protein